MKFIVREIMGDVPHVTGVAVLSRAHRNAHPSLLL